MRNAYSNLLGEYVDASVIEHADTAGFQVVCPCCRESVFKVQRERSEFFSHRQAALSQVTDCERRVSGLSPAAMAATNASSRGQSLKVFMSVIREAINMDDNHVGGSFSADDLRVSRNRLFAIKRLALFDSFFFETHKGPTYQNGYDWLEDGIRTFDKISASVDMRLATSFHHGIQSRIACDVMRTMMTEQGKRSHSHLVRHALARASLRVYASGTKQAEGADILRKIVRAFQAGTDDSVRNSFGSWDRMPGPLGQVTYAAWVRNVVEAEMLGTLMRLPYKEMLANHRKGLHPLAGLKDKVKEVGAPSLGMAYVPVI